MSTKTLKRESHLVVQVTKSPEIPLLEDDEQLLLRVGDAGVHPEREEGSPGSSSTTHLHRPRHGTAFFSVNTDTDKMVEGLFAVKCPHFLSLAC